MIKLIAEEIEVELLGKTKQIPSKRNYNKVTTIYAEDKEEYVRGVRNIELNIEYIDDENYENLEILFFHKGGKITIEDTSKGKRYDNLYIDGEEMDLTPYDDLGNNSTFYTGTIELKAK